MSIVTYNNIQLPYANSTQFQQRAVYEESNTDRILTEFDITTQCLISSTYAGLLNPRLGNVTSNPADFMAWVRQRLLQQQQSLSVIVNGIELIPQPQTGNIGVIDADNGPRPQFCNIVQLTETLFIINYRIIARYWENNNADLPSVPVTKTNTPGGDILYNRWSETVTIDENNLSVRTRHGKFVIRSDNVDGVIADILRAQFAVVGVPVGFIRTRNEYTVDPTGLALSYVQEDKEQYKMPPNPAFTAEGRIVVRAESYMARWYANVHVRLTGSGNQQNNQTDQIALLRVAFFVATAKVNILCNAQNPPAYYLIQKASVDFDLFKNIVSVDLTYWINKAPSRINMLRSAATAATSAAAAAAVGGVVPPQDPNTEFVDSFAGLSNYTPISDETDVLGNALNVNPQYQIYGTGNILLNAAAYYDPSIVGATLVQPPAVAVANSPTPVQPGALPANMAVDVGGIEVFLPQPGQVGKDG